MHLIRHVDDDTIMIANFERCRTLVLVSAILVATSFTVTGCAGDQSHNGATNSQTSLPPTIAKSETFSGVGAEVSPADTSITPAVSYSHADELLKNNGFVRQLIDNASPTRILFVQYQNKFGAQLPSGSESPSAPKQLAWFAEYQGVKVHGGSHPIQSTVSPVTWDCTYYVAVSATNGKILDAFDFCRPAK